MPGSRHRCGSSSRCSSPSGHSFSSFSGGSGHRNARSPAERTRQTETSSSALPPRTSPDQATQPQGRSSGRAQDGHDPGSSPCPDPEPPTVRTVPRSSPAAEKPAPTSKPSSERCRPDDRGCCRATAGSPRRSRWTTRISADPRGLTRAQTPERRSGLVGADDGVCRAHEDEPCRAVGHHHSGLPAGPIVALPSDVRRAGETIVHAHGIRMAHGARIRQLSARSSAVELAPFD